MAPLQTATLLALAAGCWRGGLAASPWPPAARARAAAIVAQLSLAEKVGLVSGDNADYGKPTAVSPYVGWSAGLPRFGVPALVWEDGPQGVADGVRDVTAWPSAMTVAQSWRPDLFDAWGAAMGAEQRAKGTTVMLGPAVALVRVPWSGRVFEYLGEDPVLNAALAGAMVRGVQRNNISACVKHWVLNSQEQFRGDAPGSPGMSSNVGERALRELYVPPYAAAVDSGVGTVMCSFNRVNGTYACESAAMLRDLLFGDLGFAGAVVSDWGATHSTAGSAAAGLSVEMDWARNATYYGAALAAAVASGAVPAPALDDMATRVLTAVFATTDAADAPPDPARNLTANATSPAHAALARALAVAGTVLLRNDDAGGTRAPQLPHDATTLCRVVLVGSAAALVAGGGSGAVLPPYVVSPAAGLAAALPRTTIIALDDDNATAGAAAAANADVAIVFVGTRTSEGSDRAGLALPPAQDALVAAVAAANPNTVVVARCSGACLMPWAGAVRAVVSQLYAGQEAGNALADVLLGAVSPAGKLTVSWPGSDEDTWLSAAGGGPVLPERYPGTDRGRGYPEVDYAEGLFVGYRHYDSAAASSPPLFCFGHGLTYANFTYADLRVEGAVSATSNATVRVTVTNAGGVAGADVVQLYVAGALPGDPPRALKAFAATGVLAPGGAWAGALTLSARDLSVWDAGAHAFVAFPRGSYALSVGASSCDIRLSGQVRVD